MNLNGSFKKKKVKFSQVSNAVLRDNRISLKAKGLYSLIQSYITIENFVLYKNTLKKQCVEGEKAFESAWKELKDFGYLIQERHKGTNGTFYYMYDLLDEIVHTPKKEGVDNGGSGKGGIYSNTEINNTYLNNTEYLHLSEMHNPYIDKYLEVINRNGTKQKRVSETNYIYIENEIKEFYHFPIDDFETLVEAYLEEVKSDGDILYFLKAYQRAI